MLRQEHVKVFQVLNDLFYARTKGHHCYFVAVQHEVAHLDGHDWWSTNWPHPVALII